MKAIRPVYAAESAVITDNASFVTATWYDEFGMIYWKPVHLYKGANHAARARNTAARYNAETRDPETLEAV